MEGFVAYELPGFSAQSGRETIQKESEMKTNRAYIYLIVAVLLVSGLACVRSVPGTTPKATDTPGAEQALPTNPTDVMNQIYVFATQTAMAEQGLTTPGQPQAVETGVPPAAGTPGAPPPSGQATTPAQQPAGATPQAPAPAQPVQPVLPAPTTVVPASYPLQKSEYPFCIARRFNVDPAELLRLNGLSSYSIYTAGMVLRIPQTGRPFPGNRALQPHPAQHTVGPNESIYSIACFYGDVDPMAIAYVNSLPAPYRLSVGQVLNIP
jgi:LysM repeat protein